MSMPPPDWDALARQSRARRRRRRRHRRQVMLFLLTVATTAVLVVIVLMIRDIAKAPTAARTVALSSSARAKPSRRQGQSQVLPEIADNSSGLSYRLLSSPWRQGCPSDLNTPTLSWSAGEGVVAGQVTIGGSTFNWHGLACSGRLHQPFQYSGPADLELIAMSLVRAFDPAYYSGLVHDRAIESSSTMTVSGHQAWVVRFLMTYPDAAGQGLAWTSEAGAVVVVDRGPGQAPAVFYVSVPSNLGTSHVSTLIGSLRLSRPR